MDLYLESKAELGYNQPDNSCNILQLSAILCNYLQLSLLFCYVGDEAHRGWTWFVIAARRANTRQRPRYVAVVYREIHLQKFKDRLTMCSGSG